MSQGKSRSQLADVKEKRFILALDIDLPLLVSSSWSRELECKRIEGGANMFSSRRRLGERWCKQQLRDCCILPISQWHS